MVEQNSCLCARDEPAKYLLIHDAFSTVGNWYKQHFFSMITGPNFIMNATTDASLKFSWYKYTVISIKN